MWNPVWLFSILSVTKFSTYLIVATIKICWNLDKVVVTSCHYSEFLLFPRQSVNNSWPCVCVVPVRNMNYGLRFHFTRFKWRLSGKRSPYTWFQLMHQSPCTKSPRIVFHDNYVSFFFRASSTCYAQASMNLQPYLTTNL